MKDLIEGNNSGIFIRHNLTDFEKLLFANNEIKELKIELGKVKAELDEYKDLADPNLKESITALRRANKNLRKLVHGDISNTNPKEFIGTSKWKVRYEKLFQEYIKLKNDKI